MAKRCRVELRWPVWVPVWVPESVPDFSTGVELGVWNWNFVPEFWYCSLVLESGTGVGAGIGSLTHSSANSNALLFWFAAFAMITAWRRQTSEAN